MNAFFQELFHFGLYKRSQGRITRQVTLGALAVGVALGFYRLHESLIFVPKFVVDHWPGLESYWPAVSMGLPFVLTLVCWWICYRLINVPRFADFLIAVEAEMNKVSWPTRGELFRSSAVVLICIILLAVILATYDYVWFWIFTALHILR